MTVTPMHRAGRPRRFRALLTVAAALVVLAPFAAAPAASAETPTPDPTPTMTGVVEFTLSPLANGVVRPGDALTVSATVENGTAVDLPPALVSLALGTTALPTRAALSAWLAGDGTGATVQDVGTADILDVTEGREQTAGLMVEGSNPVLAGLAPGVYPLRATYQGPAQTLTSTSAMIIPDDAAAPTSLGVIVPVTAGPLSEGLLASAELASLTQPDGSLTSLLDAVEGTEAILAVDPAIPAAVRVLGTRAPASALAWLARLDALPNSRFALQFGDADVAPQIAAEMARPAAATSLEYAMNAAAFPPASPTPQPTPTPAPTADAQTPAFPALADLLDIGAPGPEVFWPAPGTTSPAIVDALGRITTEDEPSLTLAPSTSTTAGASGGTVSARRTSGEAGVLVYDAEISRILHDASSLDDSVMRGALRTAATAHLALAQRDAGGAPLLVTIDRGTERSPVSIASTLTTALQAPGVVPASLQEIADAAPTPVELVDAGPDPARTQAASTFFADEASITRFASVLDDPRLLTGPERAELLQLLGVAWIDDPTAWMEAAQAHRAATAATLRSVDLVPVGDIQQIGPNAEIPVWVRNDLPYDVSVVLSATPDDLRLDVQRSISVTARAQSNTRVLIPVNAQIGSGDVDITFQLRSRTLQPIGETQIATVTVRADWERYGIIALGSIVGLLLVVGALRTVRRRRRARRGEEPDASAASNAAADASSEERG